MGLPAMSVLATAQKCLFAKGEGVNHFVFFLTHLFMWLFFVWVDKVHREFELLFEVYFDMLLWVKKVRRLCFF